MSEHSKPGNANPNQPDGSRCSLIGKDIASFTVASNLVDYGEECSAFSWDEAGALLDGLPVGMIGATSPKANFATRPTGSPMR
jgi:hypothetical protein